MASNIGKALLAGEVFTKYQPIVSADDLSVFYYEALVRYKDQDGLVIGPLNFLHTIEKKKLSAYLTQEVFWQSCKHFSDSNRAFSINLPLNAALDKSTMEMIESVIRNSQNGKRIIFEIQGAEWKNHYEIVRPYITKLKNLDVRFAIDDFGSGKFSFEALNDFSVDIIKIEGMLFKNWVDSRWGSTMVQSIVEYAQKHHIITVAKEIDLEETLENAVSYNVDMVQGFHIQRPMRWSELVQVATI